MIFTQPMIANQTVATPPAQIAAKSDQQRASGRAPYTFGQLAQATPGSSAGSAQRHRHGQQRAHAGRREQQPAQLRLDAEPELDRQRHDHAGRYDADTHRPIPTNSPTALPPIDTSPNQTGTSGTGAGESDKTVTPGTTGSDTSGTSTTGSDNSGTDQRIAERHHAPIAPAPTPAATAAERRAASTTALR